MFVKDDTKIASRVIGVEYGIVYFGAVCSVAKCGSWKAVFCGCFYVEDADERQQQRERERNGAL